MSVSSHLHSLTKDIWDAQHTHPFIAGIGDGSLALDRFQFWLRQDYLYLMDYARLFGVAMSKASDLESMSTMAQLGHEILHTEMALHRGYAAEFGIELEALEAEQKSPTCQGYTDFLLRTATLGDFSELMGALLPCIWGYGEIGERLAQVSRSDDNRYNSWIEMYASDEFQQLGAWCRSATDAACEGLPPASMRRVEQSFVISSRWELAFWQMAWDQQRWTR